jgi:hypothetical protein
MEFDAEVVADGLEADTASCPSSRLADDFEPGMVL